MIDAGARHRNPAAWILLGLLLTVVARLVVPFSLIALLDLHNRPSSQLSILSNPITNAATATVVYLLLRCWLLPPGPRTLRSTLALPAIVLLGAILLGWAYIPVATWLATPLLPTATDLAVELGTTTAVLPTMLFLLCAAGGLFLGAGLWATERLAAWILRQPAPTLLLLAHPVGMVILAAAGSLFTTALAQRLMVGGIGSVAMLGLVSLLLQTVASIPHLALTWFAWRPATPAFSPPSRARPV